MNGENDEIPQGETMLDLPAAAQPAIEVPPLKLAALHVVADNGLTIPPGCWLVIHSETEFSLLGNGEYHDLYGK